MGASRLPIVSWLTLVTAGTLLLAASPLPAASAASSRDAAPSPSVAPSVPSRAPDHSETLIGGVWQCETVAGGIGTHTYTSDDDGSIELETVLHTGGRTFNIAETYRFDDARAVWTATVGAKAYRGTAAPWTQPKWVFDGVAKAGDVRFPVRMVYFNLGEHAFRRDFQAREGAAWRTYSAETCTRPSN